MGEKPKSETPRTATESEEPEPEEPESGEPERGAREEGAIARRAGLVAAGTLTSRILGAARDAVVQASFAVAATDTFWLAFTIPNSLRVLLGEGAVSGAFVPVLTDVRAREGEQRARLFYARLAGAMGLVLAAVVAAGVLAPEALVRVFASAADRDAATFRDTVCLTQVVFPYIGLMGLAALVTGALHAHKRFFAPAFAPALLNIAFIAAALALPDLAEAFGLPAIGALALGALLGGGLQLLAQLPALRRIGYPLLPRLSLRDPHVQEAFRRLAPMLAGLGVYQLNVILARRFAWSLPEGSITYLFLSQRLVEIPQGMFALAIGSAALPSVAEHASRGDAQEAKRLFRYTLRLSLFVAIPSALALALLATPSVAVLYGRGAFDAGDVAQTARALIWLAGGIAAVAAVRTIVPMFHALGDTRSPVIASALNVAAFVAGAQVLMPDLGHAGLAAAITAAAVLQLITLLLLLRRRVGRLGLAEVAASVLRSGVAALAMGATIVPMLRLGRWSEGGSLRNAGVFVAIVLVGALAYLLAAFLVRSPELRPVLARLRRR